MSRSLGRIALRERKSIPSLKFDSRSTTYNYKQYRQKHVVQIFNKLTIMFGTMTSGNAEIKYGNGERQLGSEITRDKERDFTMATGQRSTVEIVCTSTAAEYAKNNAAPAT